MGDDKVKKACEIFTLAGEAMMKISTLIMQLNPQVEAPPGSKWTEEEIELLRKAVAEFGHDIIKIGEVVKTRSASQLKNALKRRIYASGNTGEEESSLKRKMDPQSSSQSSHVPPAPKHVKYEPVENITTETVHFEDDFENSLVTTTVVTEPTEALAPETVGHTDPLMLESTGDNLDDSSSSFKKLDNFISSRPSVQSRTVGGVNELAVSNPPEMPPLDDIQEG